MRMLRSDQGTGPPQLAVLSCAHCATRLPARSWPRHMANNQKKQMENQPIYDFSDDLSSSDIENANVDNQMEKKVREATILTFTRRV